MMPGDRHMEIGERYVLLRRLENRICHGEPPTTRELARELGLDRRTVCKYLCILQTADEFRLPLVQLGWRWHIFR